jgi:hypothetical protein
MQHKAHECGNSKPAAVSQCVARMGRQCNRQAHKLKLRAKKLKLKNSLKLKVCWKKSMVGEECNKTTSFAAQRAQPAA